jgi:murein DD-endopeptidase MepM/ murein hydrolase activator NlpD
MSSRASPRHLLGIAVACVLMDVGGLRWINAAHAVEVRKPTPERRLLIPVVGVTQQQLRDTFDEKRGDQAHEAIDIHAARGTAVVATDDGRVVKLFHSVPGGLTIYQADGANEWIYYYAHLDAYAKGLREGSVVKRGDVIGYVGSTGNASPNAPHLHFALLLLPPGKEWWKGTAINPYPYFTRSGP